MEVSSSTPKQGESHGTRRNTRSTANPDKDRDNADNGKNGFAVNVTDKDQDTLGAGDTQKKRHIKVVRAQNGDVLEYTTEDDVTYKPLDSVYLATERPDNPYFIGTIQDIRVSKRDNAIVSVKWYYRPIEVPDLVYQMLVKERYSQVGPAMKDRIMKPDTINRELFVDDRMDAAETYPISSLRGKCDVTHYSGIAEVANFEPRPDHFFYIFGYSPDTRRLASSKGETSIGPSHQWNAKLRGIFQKAELPDLLDPADERRCYGKGRVYEEATWLPNVNKCDLIMCLRAARSLAAFAGVCDGVSPEEGCIVASRDDTTINALRVLFENKGDTRKAIDDLVLNPVPVTIESKWTDDQVKRFQKGLRLHGKKFFKIRKELLPMKETGEVVEFYYMWKKAQDSLVPNHRKHRRKAVIKSSCKVKANNGNGSGDTSTEEETEESEESEKEVNYKCEHCDTTTSNEWLPGGKDGVMLCTDCRIFFKKYGENRPVIKVEDLESENETDADTPPAAPKSQLPPFLFKPIKEDKVVVSNLIPRKPAKSLAKVNTTMELKTRSDKHSKRQWSNSEETKVKHEAAPANLKRPKTEPPEADDHSRPNQDGRAGTATPRSVLNGKPEEQIPELKPSLSQSSGITPKIITTLNGAYAPYSRLEPREISDPVKRHAVLRNDNDSASMSPFVSAGQAQVSSSAKPSELEAISKLTIGLIPRSIYPTVGYVGAGTPTALSSQTSTSRQSSSTYAFSGNTTVTTTSTVRSSPTVEPSTSGRPGPSETESPGQPLLPREQLPPRDFTTEGRCCNARSPPRTGTSDDRENPGRFPHGGHNLPPQAAARSSRFPFDPRFADQIFSKANMTHLAPLSSKQSETQPPLHPYAGPARGSPVPRHNVKQEYYPNSQSSRSHPHGEQMPRHPQSGYQRSHTRSPNPQGSRLPGSSRHPSQPAQSHRPRSPRHSAPVQTRPQLRDRDDSDVELINDTSPESPSAIPDRKTLITFGNARFLKVWNRGSNSCFRTDFVYLPDQASEQSRRDALREFRRKKSPEQDAGNPPPAKRPRTPSTHGLPSDQDRKRDEKSDALERSRRDCRPLSSSNLPNPAHRSTPGQVNAPPARTPTTSYEQHQRPALATFVSPFNTFGSDTPALRQLQQYASVDMRRNAAAEAAMGPMHPYYHLGGFADAELRERELRDRETWEHLVKMGIDVKPSEMFNPHQLSAPGLHVGAVPASMAGQHLASVEQQMRMRQYHAQLLNSLPPGINPHAALAMAANLPPGVIPGNPFNQEAYAAAERLSFDRLQAERLAAAAEQQYQLELLHHHSHSHVHSHLHLHPLGQHGGAPGPPPATPHPLGVPPPPPGLAVADQLVNPYAAVTMQAMHPFAVAAASGNPDILPSPVIRNQQAVAAQAALMQQSLAAPHLQAAAAAAAAREQSGAAQPHPFSQNLQALHEQHVIETQHRARAVALQEQQFLAQAAARYKP